MKAPYLILDCYVDEPACLGVPPFIAPYPRLIRGALIDGGTPPESIEYLTIDHMREREYRLDRLYQAVFLIGGAVVPGRYMGARIGTLTELRRIIDANDRQRFVVGGLISHVMDRPAILAVLKDVEAAAYTLARGEMADRWRTTEEGSRWAVLGADIVKQHPWFPHIMCEIETGRGCPRTSHCSFCSEGLMEFIEFRRSDDILEEVEALMRQGVTRFRLGRQADILQFGSSLSGFRNGFPQPSPESVESLFGPLGKLRREGRIHTLNIDNGNPGTIVHFPSESERILTAIAEAVTPGDTLAMGIESFDSEVVNRNSLKVYPHEALDAVERVNRLCGDRSQGVPRLLPGINLIHGLPGETPETFRTNYTWLKTILDRDLLLRRINIRKILPFPGTPLYERIQPPSRAMTNRFEYYRDRIRDDIDHEMLKKIYPVGTVLKDVMILESHGGFSYGKQIASYAIAAKHPVEMKTGGYIDSLVIGHQERSLLALPVPIDINALPARALERIPGIGKKGATGIILQRPLDREQKDRVLESLPRSIPLSLFI